MTGSSAARWLGTTAVTVLIATLPLEARAAQTGIEFLCSAQDASGAWSPGLGTEARDTTAILDALEALNRAGTCPSLAISFLESTTASNVDGLARQVKSLSEQGSDVSSLIVDLAAAQEGVIADPARPNFPGGGWGIGAGFTSDVLDTALAVRALVAAGMPLGTTVVGESVLPGFTSPSHDFDFPVGASGLLLHARATSGAIRVLIDTPTLGTFFLDLGPGNVPVDIVGLPEEPGTYGLSVQNLDASTITHSLDVSFTTAGGFDVGGPTRALRYLAAAQNADGGFGLSVGEDSQLVTTAQALWTLTQVGSAFAPDAVATQGAAHLGGLQNGDGGFGSVGVSSAWETALVALALEAHDPAAPELPAARNHLAMARLANNTWNDDAYETAMALRIATNACNDGADNDGDGLIDFGLDPGCATSASDLESPECNDGADNDGDGLTDLDDPHCSSSADNREKAPAPGPTCGLGPEVLLAMVGLHGLAWRRARRARHAGGAR
jgi:hypothetical protein